MKAEELRVGNLIYSTMYLKYFVVDVDLDFFYDLLKESISIKNFAPIPLTEEWLEKFGFEKNMKSTWIIQIFQENFLEISFGSYPTFEFGNYFSERWNDPMRIDYVHQLQNLYFALSGREL